jgi:hypothetical protein
MIAGSQIRETSHVTWEGARFLSDLNSSDDYSGGNEV